MLALGIDFGTSGARAIALSEDRQVVAQGECAYSQQTPQIWQESLFSLLQQLPLDCRQQIDRIAINGTSGTVLLCDRAGQAIADPLMYNDDRGKSILPQVREVTPSHHSVNSATSSFAKLFWYDRHLQLLAPPYYFLHQADWLGFLLHGELGVSDYHNALKLGYDVQHLCYPDWLSLWVDGKANRIILPEVSAPGEAIAPVLPKLCAEYGFPTGCLVCAGTTDSIAAFMASGASHVGDGVTSLGSTLVLKLLSDTAVDDARYGIYSHRFGDRWLVGGASNTGGAVLRHFFSDRELDNLSRHIDPQQESPLDYYPLLGRGDRFPINDPNLEPRLEPRPEHPADFLHGLLESIARIESIGYQRLWELGASPLLQLYSAGGGAKNNQWTKIRQRHLSVPFRSPLHPQAAYGSACLALSSL
ncbi:FGGY-family carbohydrate kinase [Roseofilum casamattae]|uniref:FGGY-family carbohydrate kinase n=1 Tax=Roseofilum casamattae BLCC-M143 TaxID=3022442 RepID=A0ABT7C3D3_9CYAN|nr:FGGY-family carbohydrate kinase [Roseofilum casamattae]MDJ1185063.1 FGGY-family carbohydrate kinase [Roseofilum casamattae BLCC-M143]